MSLSDKALRIKVVVLDVDGVLTDGRIGYGADSSEIKFFDVKDGLGIKLLQRAGIRVGILSGRESKANRIRSEELNLDFVYEQCLDKASAFDGLLKDLSLSAVECVYLGDDLVDLPVMKAAGIAIAVSDARPEVKAVSDMVTGAGGGCGAVREAAEWVLKQRGLWDSIVEAYRGDS